MNILNFYSKKINQAIKKGFQNIEDDALKKLSVELPPEQFDFDLSSNAPMVLAKKYNLKPMELAKKFKEIFIKEIDDFNEIDIIKPGFLNIKLKLSAIEDYIKIIFNESKKFGSLKEKKKFNLEFVSANPTGPMHVGHCRGAIFGDVISNLLKFNGNDVVKEYYINDYGNQVNFFAKSVFYRIREIKENIKFPQDKNLYPGHYIKDIAKKIIKDFPKKSFSDFNKNLKIITDFSLKTSMKYIKDDLKSLGIHHDVFISEKEILAKTDMNKLFDKMENDGFVEQGFLKPPINENKKSKEKKKKLIFKSSSFGDDNDRALVKDDGSWTYFANDIAYHNNKVERKFDFLINILGADHTGYIKRITAAVEALSKNKTKLICKVCQLVKLFKKGEPYKMSKRAGEFVSAKDLLSEVSKDVVRFMMLYRSNDVELDFDFDKVLEKNKDNPVFYVQYCNARINSIFRIIKKDITKINFSKFKNKLNYYEIKILRKIFEWPKIIQNSSIRLEPHRIPFYLYELSTLFHTYWSKGNEDKHLRFLDGEKIQNPNSLIIMKIIYIVLHNGMKILNVSLPQKM
tara:strand:+ start:527 stop:2239 length:1713 start_codon:yes stop_codon:yes gene_type:complete